MDYLNKMYMSVKLTKVAFDIKGAFGLEELKIKSRFSEDVSDVWTYSSITNTGCNGYGTIAVIKSDTVAGFERSVCIMFTVKAEEIVRFGFNVNFGGKDEKGEFAKAELWSDELEISEQYEFRDLNVKCVNLVLKVDYKNQLQYDVATKYLNGDWYMKEDKK